MISYVAAGGGVWAIMGIEGSFASALDLLAGLVMTDSVAGVERVESSNAATFTTTTTTPLCSLCSFAKLRSFSLFPAHGKPCVFGLLSPGMSPPPSFLCSARE